MHQSEIYGLQVRRAEIWECILFKGTVSPDFLLLINHLLLCPLKIHFEFCQKFAEFFAKEGATLVSIAPAVNWHWWKIHDQCVNNTCGHIFPRYSLIALTQVVNFLPLSTTLVVVTEVNNTLGQLCHHYPTAYTLN